MIAGRECPICLRVPTEEFDANYKICRCCGQTVLSWQYDTVEEYENIYKTDYLGVFQKQHGLTQYVDRYELDVTAAKIRLSIYNLILGPTFSICDVGAGNGAFVDVAGAIGYDPTPMNSKIIKGGWKDVTGSFDLITMHDVLEHLVDPVGCLEHLKNCINGGTIVVELPEFNSPNGAKHLRPEQHLFLPDFDAAQQLFKNCGLVIKHFYRPKNGRLGKFSFFLTNV